MNYGATYTEAQADFEDAYSDDDFDGGNASFLMGKEHTGKVGLLGVANVLMSIRGFKSALGEEYKMVPTLTGNNTVLVCDPNLESNESGTFYYSEESY